MYGYEYRFLLSDSKQTILAYRGDGTLKKRTTSIVKLNGKTTTKCLHYDGYSQQMMISLLGIQITTSVITVIQYLLEPSPTIRPIDSELVPTLGPILQTNVEPALVLTSGPTFTRR